MQLNDILAVLTSHMLILCDANISLVHKGKSLEDLPECQLREIIMGRQQYLYKPQVVTQNRPRQERCSASSGHRTTKNNTMYVLKNIAYVKTMKQS